MKNLSHKTKVKRLEKWVEDYGDDLFQWAFYKTSDKEKSNDLLQDTFLKAFQKIDDFQEKSEAKTWLFAILNHLIIDFYRSQNKDPLKNIDADFFNSQGKWVEKNNPKYWNEMKEDFLMNDPEFISFLDHCIDELPTKWAAIIREKYINGKKSAWICQEFDIQSSNYWQIIHRSKIKLRVCLEKKWFKQN